MPLSTLRTCALKDKYIGRPYNIRIKIYAARMSHGSSSYRTISAARARPQQQTRRRRCWDRQTDGRTLDRFMTLSTRMQCGRRRNSACMRLSDVCTGVVPVYASAYAGTKILLGNSGTSVNNLPRAVTQLHYLKWFIFN